MVTIKSDCDHSPR